MAILAKLLSGGFLAGYRTYLIGFGLAAQALGLWLAGDLALSDFLARMPEILGGMGLMALTPGPACPDPGARSRPRPRRRPPVRA